MARVCRWLPAGGLQCLAGIVVIDMTNRVRILLYLSGEEFNEAGRDLPQSEHVETGH
jgi:hypothetical protein